MTSGATQSDADVIYVVGVAEKSFSDGENAVDSIGHFF